MKQTKNKAPTYQKRPEEGLTAILLGATGLTGGILLRDLLKDPRYKKIILFSRRPTEVKHPKIKEFIIDLFDLKQSQGQFIADQVYCCIGTTQKKTPNKEIYRNIDYGIPVVAARLAKMNKIPTFLVISAMGADPESRFFYNKTKGDMERDVLNQNIPDTYIFQPSLIAGNRKEKRTFEFLAKGAMKLGNYLLLGPLKKYRSISPEIIAKTMILIANNGYPKNRVISNEIKRIAQDDSKKTD